MSVGMTAREFEDWKVERDRSLLELDLDTIRHSHPDLAGRNDSFILLVAHKARCQSVTLPLEKMDESRKWLRDNGYSIPE